MNGWLCFGYCLIVYFGLTLLDVRREINSDHYPSWFAAVIHLLMFILVNKAYGIPYLIAIPMSSVITLFTGMTFNRSYVGNIWISSLYLSLWIYGILILFYFLGMFSILLGGTGAGFGNYYYDRY